MSSLLSSNSAAAAAIGRVRCLADEEADHNMLQDLHLAAELGKTLLERNKELEATIKTYQTTIEDQALEIEYLKKQVTAMKEVNNSRLKVYENLEQVINDLEHKNQQLENEKAKDKNKIVSLRKIVDEVQNRYHDLEDKHEALKRVQQTLEPPASPRNRAMLDSSIQNGAVSPTSLLSEKSDSSIKDCISLPNDDEMKRQLQESRQQRANVQKKLNELMEQMSLLVQEKSDMEEQMEEKAQQVSSLERDVKHLEELWKGQLCRLCGSTMERDTDAPSMLLEEDEELDTRSLAESLADSYQDSGFMMQASIYKSALAPIEELSELDYLPAAENSLIISNSPASPTFAYASANDSLPIAESSRINDHSIPIDNPKASPASLIRKILTGFFNFPCYLLHKFSSFVIFACYNCAYRPAVSVIKLLNFLFLFYPLKTTYALLPISVKSVVARLFKIPFRIWLNVVGGLFQLFFSPASLVKRLFFREFSAIFRMPKSRF